MPNRMLREEILGSARVDALSFGAEVFYRRLMSIVDDYGRFELNLMMILARCYPMRYGSVSVDDIERWLEECRISSGIAGFLPEDAGDFSGSTPLITVYQVERKNYLQINNFNQRLRPNQRSKYPDPTEAETVLPGTSGQCREKSASRAQTATTPATTTPEVLEKEDGEVFQAEIVALTPAEPVRVDQDPIAILEEARRIYAMGGLPITDNPRQEQLIIQHIVGVDREKRPRILNFVKFAFSSGRWSTPGKTKAFLNLLRDGDWDVELTQRTLPMAREPTAQDAMRAASSAKAAQYMREKGRL